VVFVIALAITVILSGMLLVFAQQMRSEAMTSGSRASVVQADAIEKGAEQWVLAQIEANVTPLTGTASNPAASPVDPTTIPAEALQVGDGYFWLLHPDPTQDQTYAFGIVDESSKINLNGASVNTLGSLPDMTTDLATLISEWPTDSGISGTLNFESVEDLFLVDPTMTPTILYGYDLNHDGVIDAAEMAASNGAATSNGTTTDSRGIFNYVTCYSTNAQPGTVGTTASTPRTKKTIGLVNINTAPAQVLQCLPGMTSDLAQNIVSGRATASITPFTTTWLSQVAGQGTATLLAPYITGVSYQYSADIVAVSGDGRAFKRVRIVIDTRAQPASIIYRKDLTSLGWPLPPEVQTSLRQGKGVPQDVTGTSNAQTAQGLSK
jgi:DNA uptake protein ComE-like DNA-binding protein